MKKFSKEHRENLSISAKKRCTVEWRKNISEKQSIKLDIEQLRTLYSSGKTQTEIAVIFGVSQKAIWGAMKRNGIKARIPVRKNQSGENSSNWKGELASYKALHYRVMAQRGKAKEHGCSVCGINKPNIRYEWANLTGNYGDVEDYAAMCKECHSSYDKKRKKGVVQICQK